MLQPRHICLSVYLSVCLHFLPCVGLSLCMGSLYGLHSPLVSAIVSYVVTLDRARTGTYMYTQTKIHGLFGFRGFPLVCVLIFMHFWTFIRGANSCRGG